MKKLSRKNLIAVRGGGACLSPAAPALNNCPGYCMASQIVFYATGHGLGQDGGYCIV